MFTDPYVFSFVRVCDNQSVAMHGMSLITVFPPTFKLFMWLVKYYNSKGTLVYKLFLFHKDLHQKITTFRCFEPKFGLQRYQN